MTAKEHKARRAMYVKAWLEGVKNRPAEIKKLSLRLFVSESTIRRDIKRKD